MNVQCVLWLSKFESVSNEQNEYRRMCVHRKPQHSDIINWQNKQLKDTNSVLYKTLFGRPLRWNRQEFCQAMATMSPDLRHRFNSWGYMKQHVYNEHINDINTLKQRITDSIHSVTTDALNGMWEELEYRLNVCKATNRGYIKLH
ncbi:uncharacterized protein NPIL_503561 [Nephila pilipes]|uniref:Uncharacterized protein n=1 Tax=Nephila pilipes TaxID=299642 RepID=A0A8X6PI17_NEPPI|nr:uncharacterized protein NPIL_503561 [Nephila pilipes]